MEERRGPGSGPKGVSKPMLATPSNSKTTERLLIIINLISKKVFCLLVLCVLKQHYQILTNLYQTWTEGQMH